MGKAEQETIYKRLKEAAKNASPAVAGSGTAIAEEARYQAGKRAETKVANEWEKKYITKKGKSAAKELSKDAAESYRKARGEIGSFSEARKRSMSSATKRQILKQDAKTVGGKVLESASKLAGPAMAMYDLGKINSAGPREQKKMLNKALESPNSYESLKRRGIDPEKYAADQEKKAAIARKLKEKK